MTETTLMGVGTIIAIILGPIVAVLITRWVDDLRQEQQRRTELFRTLMRTRRMVLAPEHVSALNLVEVEFHDKPKVLAAWKKYWEHLSKSVPEPRSEKVGQFVVERDALLAKLLHEIGKVVGINIDKLEIFQGGYAPEGWLEEENQLRALRFLLIQMLSGQRALPVVPFTASNVSSPYPPPPFPEVSPADQARGPN